MNKIRKPKRIKIYLVEIFANEPHSYDRLKLFYSAEKAQVYYDKTVKY